MEIDEQEKVSCSSMGYKSQQIAAGTYRSKYIPPNGTDRDKVDAIDDLFTKMGWIEQLCIGGCSNDSTQECKCTGLMSKSDDDCELTLEIESDGTRYYKVVVKAPGNVELKCPGLAGDTAQMCKCLTKPI